MPANESTATGEDATLAVWTATGIGAALTPLIALVVFGPYWLFWGTSSLVRATAIFAHLEILLPALVISVVAHEALHLLGYRIFGKIRWKDFRWGFKLWPLAAYVYATTAVTSSTYRWCVALPAIVLGAAPTLIGIAGGSGWMLLYGFLMLISAGGDFAILWRIRRIPAIALVLDHPHRAGCTVLSQAGTLQGGPAK